MNALLPTTETGIKTKPKKSEWPKVVKAKNAKVSVYRRMTGSGNFGYQIRFHDTDGTRKTLSYSDEAEAMREAATKAETLSTFGVRVATVGGNEMAEHVRLTDLLKPRNISVTVAVERVNTWLNTFPDLDAIDRVLAGGPVKPVADSGMTVKTVVEELIKYKEGNGVGEHYKSDLRWRLREFAENFKCTLTMVTPITVQAWLDGKKMKATSYMNYRRVLHVLFEYCVRRGYIATNPIARLESRKANTGKTEIYTVEEMKSLLAKASDELKPMLLICGFAGIRTEEFRRMTWDSVDFEGSHIILDVNQAKTASRRVVPMSDNLKAWLLPFKKNKGRIWRTQRRQLSKIQSICATAAGIKWKKNALRHSFCSYRLALSGDAARVAFEAGNSANMIHRHYKALVTEAQAKEWFNIMPE